MKKSLCLGLLLAAETVGAQERVSSPAAELQTLAWRCEARLETLQQHALDARRTGNILLVLGTSIAALGSALAGFLSKASHRKAMAVVGALGAVTAVLPKTLDDPSELLARRSAAERHRDMALKVRFQMRYHPRSYVRPGTQYLIARLVDCTSSAPPEKVPDPPVPDPPPVFLDGDGIAQQVPEVMSPEYPGRKSAQRRTAPAPERPQVRHIVSTNPLQPQEASQPVKPEPPVRQEVVPDLWLGPKGLQTVQQSDRSYDDINYELQEDLTDADIKRMVPNMPCWGTGEDRLHGGEFLERVQNEDSETQGVHWPP